MGKKLNTHFHNDGKKFAEVHLETRDEFFYVKFFENDGRLIETRQFEGKTLGEVNDVVESWCNNVLLLG
jgi:hypothetical protein